MAVYTPLDRKEIEAFLAYYSVGHLVSFIGIAEGSENTNYLVKMDHGSRHSQYILTIFEQRVKTADLPFFLGLTEWLSDHGIACPQPVRGRNGGAVYKLKGKSAALIYFIEGRSAPHITPHHMELTGRLIAHMHLAAQKFAKTRPNALSLAGWHSLYNDFLKGRADTLYSGLEKFIGDELAYLDTHWPHGLPSGVIHADLFPDNVFFRQEHHEMTLSGVLDFYFACNDFWMYDLAVCMNAWCFDADNRFLADRAKSLFAAYDHARPLTRAEHMGLPVLARGAALRFLITRACDWLNPARKSLVKHKNPLEYAAKLRFHQQVKIWREYGIE